MADALTKTQLDKLGDRLRQGAHSATDIRALDEYRHSFRAAFDSVMTSLEHVGVEKTGRMKTVAAIAAKLNRQRIRLTQVQDIAGVRLTCADAPDQDLLTKILAISLFPGSELDDRRERPSHGYRAVHLIVTSESGRLVEIQIRTRAQHRWAQLSEKLADLLDPAIKYGGGPKWAQSSLAEYSNTVRVCEDLERQHNHMLHLAHEARARTADVATAAEHAKLVASATDLETKVQNQRAVLDRELEAIAALIERSARDLRGQN